MKFYNFLKIVAFCFTLSCNSVSDSPINENPNTPESYGVFIDDWTYSVNPNDTDNFSTAEFRLWVPENTEPSGVLILSGHYNSNSLHLANNVTWQSFATANNLAIVATHLIASADQTYSDASGGSGTALIRSVSELANKHNLANFSRLPYYLRGFSAGGTFSYSFSEHFNNKVAAIVDIRGARESINSNTNNVTTPGLILVGDQELDRIERAKAIIAEKRGRQGYWAYAVEPNTHHSSSLDASDDLARSFFEQVMSNLNFINNSTHTEILNNSWLGNNETKEIEKYNEYTEDKTNASWLIDNSFATKWKTFQ